MKLLTVEELKAIRERADKATPGPWRWDTEFCEIRAVDDYDRAIVETDSGCYGPCAEDAMFIAAVRADVPALLDHIAELQQLLDFMRRSSR
jgi:hypothetical protein